MSSQGSKGRAVEGSILILALLLGLLLVLSVDSPTGATHVGGHDVNGSIVFYKPTSKTTGLARFGTLDEGTLTMKGRLETKRWTHAAVGHDTLLFYNSSSGQGMTGTFRNGVFTRRSIFWIEKDFDRVAASCDSVFFFRTSNMASRVGLLEDGWLSALHQPGFAGQDFTGHNLVSSSCDTIFLWRNQSFTAGQAREVTADLVDGKFALFNSIPGSFTNQFTHMTSTADSYLQYAKPEGYANWGTSQDGVIDSTNASETFGNWTHVAGTGDSVLFYNTNSGVAARVILKNGLYNDEAPGTGVSQLAKGWKIIAGGR